uniref:Small ribosomal subunit protein uS15m n=1 Tax=Amblyomma sculptum TaxID=1581419 RepID=A0A1E1XUQ6_AMBSC
MSSLVRLSCSVSTVRSLFSKLSVTDSITRVTSAALHSAALSDHSSPDGVLRRRTHASSPTHISHRFRSRKILSWPTDYLPYEWSYPPPFDLIANSGDLVHDTGPTDPTMPLLGFELSDELKTASPEVQRVFSLQLASLKEIHEAKKLRFVRLCQRHPYDFDSFESRVAQKTFTVRRLKELHNRKPLAKNIKDWLWKAILKRNKALKRLYRYDRQRFNFVSSTLQVTYTPARLHHIEQPITKKGELRRLTREYCEKMKADKMKAFHEKLKAEQAAFLEEKRQAEEWIRAEEERLGLTEEERKSTEHVGILDKLKHAQ